MNDYMYTNWDFRIWQLAVPRTNGVFWLDNLWVFHRDRKVAVIIR